MKKLFGTDGIRGIVGRYPLTQEAVFTIGRSLGLWLKEQYPKENGSLKVVVGRDTRESGDGIEAALLKGAGSEGLGVHLAGVCPTPAVAYLARVLGAHLGVAISASHNPFTDNGIKFFNADGYKFSSFAEKRIEEIFFGLGSGNEGEAQADSKSRGLVEASDCISLYSKFAADSLKNLKLDGMRIVIDCAFGSFSRIAPEIFQKLGADVFAINNEPDGKNINLNCGALYPDAMRTAILKHNADIGIAFDGDGDRVIIADEKGNVLDGDNILAILARHFAEQKRLPENTVVCTAMSNLGLELYLQGLNIRMIRTKVGDKYVLEEMLKTGAGLGGEQSGHIIILEHTTTGDGLIAVLEVVKLMRQFKKPLSLLAENFQRFPQVLVNVKVREKRPFEEITGLNDMIERCRAQLSEASRILVRYSGTEGLARVMIEAGDPVLVKRCAESIAGVIREAAGETSG
jgi:phosphoglucosamine mutase